ncbi:MAG TPA: hypothetical protein VI094_13325 [Propionibacteriaceae bacterium]
MVGLARRPTLIGAQIRDGVIDVDRAAHRRGVGEDIGGSAATDEARVRSPGLVGRRLPGYGGRPNLGEPVS